MKEIARFTVDPGAAGYVQMLSYEVDGLRVLNAQIARSGGDRERYLKEYEEMYAEYRTAYDALVGEVCPEYVGQPYTTALIFARGELVVYEK